MRRLFAAIITLYLVSVLIPSRDAAALPINVIKTEYTTFVSTDDRLHSPSSRTTTSSTPISDYLSQQSTSSNPLLYSGARANLFDITVFSSWANYGTAYANAELRFSPLMDTSQSLEIHFAGWDHWFWSNAYISLFDISSNQELWNYDPISWVIQNGINPIDIMQVITSFRTIDTDFSAAHTYELNIFAQVFPAGDPATPTITLQLFGLEPVPEPATLFLLGCGLFGLVGLRRKFKQ